MLPLTTVADVEAVLGRPLTDFTSVGALIALASGLVADEMGYTVDPDPIPGEVAAVTVGVVVRAIVNPHGVVQDTSGPFTVRYADGAEPGVYLTDAERRRLHRARGGAQTGLWTLSTTRGDFETTRYVYDQLGGDAIPFETTF